MTATQAANASEQLPADWPGPGPIDLDVHDLPHASAGIEWWYTNFHLRLDDGGTCSLFACFFRANSEPGVGDEDAWNHAVTWALVDADAGTYTSQAVLDRRLPSEIRQRLDELVPDPYHRRALAELLDRGDFPLPDQIFAVNPIVDPSKLDLQFGELRLRKVGGSYELTLVDREGSNGADLTFTPEKSPVRHGDDGVVEIANERMFYYFVPRCSVTGSITVAGARRAVASGSGWYDHEFGNLRSEYDDGQRSRARASTTANWRWFCIQLEGGDELAGYEATDTQRLDQPPTRLLLHISSDGVVTRSQDVQVTPVEMWRSCRTFGSYATRLRVCSVELDVDIELAAEFADQEFRSLLSAPAFHESRVRVHGTVGGRSACGLGFVEQAGFNRFESQEEFLSAVGDRTRAEIHRMFYDPSGRPNPHLVADAGHAHLLEGFDLAQFARQVVDPVHGLVERGGKAWRSFAMMAAMDAVGGDPNRYPEWLAVPEIIHTGSLIVDDVEDASDTRRGGPAVHYEIGIPLAINAGSASYFFAQLPLLASDLSPEIKCRWYEYYFEAMRGAHAGQAADIAGVWEHVGDAVATGDTRKLEAAILANHRLKSGLSPGNVARMAAVVAGGTEEQIEALGLLFEAYGTAFQIVDDILNIRGFEKASKTVGEDIREHKITFPVAKCFSLQKSAARERLSQLLLLANASPRSVAEAIDLITDSGALEACDAEARVIVEVAWAEVDRLLPPTQSKVALRAFGWYVLDRQY